MAINKVVYDGDTLIDLSNDTLDYAGQISSGIIAHNKAGEPITGTNPYNAENVGAALADSLAALTEKGVTVSGSEDIDDLAGLIAAIETGGLPDGLEAVTCGTIMMASNQTAQYTITHNLGDYPDVFAIREMSADTTKVTIGMVGYVLIRRRFASSTYEGFITRYAGAGGVSNTTIPTSTTVDYITNTKAYIPYTNSAHALQSGKKYAWIAARFAR